ncbi:hypothetical protein [Kiloniella sp. b19]|uniref:hypothetical protein n=1 Tax=Kiloniella sp. GXU_MW_B19 TaxID=3141326 RepID=UPI0031CFFC8A
MTVADHHPSCRGETTKQKAAEGFLKHYFRRISPDVAQSFNKEQRAAIRTMFGDRGMASHIVEIRRSLPFFARRRFYLIFLIGRERRTLERLEDEGQMATSLAYLLTGIILCIPGVALSLLVSLFL